MAQTNVPQRAGSTPEKLAQHTPGPWVIYGPRDKRVDIQVEHVVPGNDTASAFNQGVCDIDEFTCRARPAEALANARLIAAAPMMLDALRDALALLETCEPPECANEGDLAFWCERRDAAIAGARAAIRSAEGTTPSPAGA